MTFDQFHAVLAANAAVPVRFRLPDGALVPAHAHVTEVARVEKRFVDCGGTLRDERWCRLQVWVADDTEHRLTAGKLAQILDKGRPVLGDAALEVDVEYEAPVITQFPALSAEPGPEGVVVSLGTRRTACLAPEKCLPPSPAPATAAIGFRSRPRPVA